MQPPPPRIFAPTEGRNSIVYSNLPPAQDTTKFFFIDNKATDIENYNQDKDHSHYFTNIVQTQNINSIDSSTQQVNLDDRSRWGGELHTFVKTSSMNCTEFFNSSSCRVKLMSRKTPREYKWYDLTIPEGNYILSDLIDLLNDGIVALYMTEGRQNGVLEEDIGVKFDTRNFNLGLDPVQKLIAPGKYCQKGYHVDIVLLPGCAVDFSESRFGNLMGFRKRQTYTHGFVISYEDLEGGNIFPLLDVQKWLENKEIKPVLADPSGRSYHVEKLEDYYITLYRSFCLAYNVPSSLARKKFLLCDSDITGGLNQLYWCMPDFFKPPVTFKQESRLDKLPVVAMEQYPFHAKTAYNPSAVYNQLVESLTNEGQVFNRFFDNEILRQPPALNQIAITENVPLASNQGTIPIFSTLPGVQRVVLEDDRRRTVPYVTKSLATVLPKVLSSATLQ
ncbi:III [Psittacine adenovirus 2]|uniref:III n=1 Tax=Psittacine adenovirus 2 TaxID=1301246 RepID=A0ABX8SN97_9ADEN|nr:penton [Psittacine adenovirus 2]QZW33247.1 ORF08 penton [Psittacine siadenovirus F]QXX30952.1 III [Psittacine adenovirus 2]QZW33691.1 ORF08 penton [Psittacine adenovirus 2]WGL41016.1 penton [Psittacine siadenovirus F]